MSIVEYDRLGNTALMYAALCGNTTIVHMLVDSLANKWCFDVIHAKNVMGHTAEDLSKMNGYRECAL